MAVGTQDLFLEANRVQTLEALSDVDLLGDIQDDKERRITSNAQSCGGLLAWYRAEVRGPGLGFRVGGYRGWDFGQQGAFRLLVLRTGNTKMLGKLRDAGSCPRGARRMGVLWFRGRLSIQSSGPRPTL